jgi:diguanylate cyclase (GGDEF)-like protein
VDILIVEDDSSTRAVLAKILGARGHKVTECCRAEHAIEQYRHQFYPLILLDLYLPGMNGFEFCHWLRAEPDGDRPFVLVGTSSSEPGDLRKILEAGADDYLVKPYQPELLDVRLAVAEQALKTRAARKQLEIELAQERERLSYLASHDSLTKLSNREHFTGAVDSAVMSAQEGGPPGALLYMDLDNFKIVNDALGHPAGDRLLVQLAYLFRNAVRPQDEVARLGGDEFLVLQENISPAEARLTAERIRGCVSDFRFCDSGKSFQLGISIGVAEITGESTPEYVLAAGDAACYAAKARGRNRVEPYENNERELTQLRNDAHWCLQIRDGFKSHTFALWFQPVVNLATGRPEFHEALVRLHTTDGEIAEPAHFLGPAERYHLAGEIDRRVIRLALRRLAAEPNLRVSINLCAQSLTDAGFADFVRKTFHAAGVSPARVTFEVSETDVVSHLDSTRTLVNALRGESFRFALDDFGTGFSSFSYLKDLPIDYLKIDGSFVRELVSDPINRQFVRVMNDIAAHLKVPAVAEHIESAEALELLRGMGVVLGQGNYFGCAQPDPQL